MQTRSSQDARGIDISHWQGTIDWAKVHKAGITFAYMKATEGTGYVDPSFSTNFTHSKNVGILRGGYHFARPSDSSPEVQADFFVKTLHAHGSVGELPPALDLEDAGGKSETALTQWVEGFVNRVQSKTGVQPVLYVSPSFASSFLKSTVSNLPLWVADWGISRPGDFNGWGHWTFWQYTDTGSISGISGNVDLDVFAGTVATLHQRFGSTGSSSGSGSGTGSSGGSTPLKSLPTLSQGDTGKYVKDLQLLLYRADQHPNGVSGTFDANTKISVEAFQKQAGITVDGIVGPVTWSHLVNHPFVKRPTLQLWAGGQDVLDLQYLLQFHGENPGSIDGIFGPTTQSAVKSLQGKKNLPVTGVVDEATWKVLMQDLPAPIG